LTRGRTQARKGRQHAINGRLYELQRNDFTVPFGEMEVWEYRNLTHEFHPMHVHGTQVQVLERRGLSTLAPEDAGWRDTVLVRPKETVRVLARFGAYTGAYVHHCHNLEHADNGMMQNFTVQEAARRSNGLRGLRSR
jgi:spore coat protein A